jgi:HEAT repeat protein
MIDRTCCRFAAISLVALAAIFIQVGCTKSDSSVDASIAGSTAPAGTEGDAPETTEVTPEDKAAEKSADEKFLEEEIAHYVAALTIDENDPGTQMGAMDYLLELGPPAAKPALPALIQLFENEKVHYTARRQAARTLGKMGKDLGDLDREAVEALVRQLQNLEADPWVRMGAAEGLPSLVDEEDGDLALILGEMLGDPEFTIRNHCATSLAVIGSGAVPSIIAALRSTNQDARDFAARAVERMQPKGANAEKLLPVIVEVLRDEHWLVRYRAAMVLARNGSEAQADAVPALFEGLRDKEWQTRREAMNAIYTVNPNADGFVAEVKRLSQDEHGGVSTSAVLILRKMGLDG